MLLNHQMSLHEAIAQVCSVMARATADKRSPMRNTTLATMRQGSIRQRMVVMRQFSNFNIQIYTDSRSGKMQDMERNNQVSLHFWHPRYKLQVVLLGRLQVRSEPSIFEAPNFNTFPESATRTYRTKLAPGTPLRAPLRVLEMLDAHDDTYFTVLEFKCTSGEILQLGAQNHLRLAFTTSEKGWTGSWLSP